jgi:hypothetical protein
MQVVGLLLLGVIVGLGFFILFGPYSSAPVLDAAGAILGKASTSELRLLALLGQKKKKEKNASLCWATLRLRILMHMYTNVCTSISACSYTATDE